MALEDPIRIYIFDHEWTLFSRALEIIVNKENHPFYGRKIQVSEIL